MQSEYTHQSYSKLFEEIIKKDDVTTASVLLGSLYGVMSDENRSEVFTTIYASAMSGGSAEMQKLFVKNFGMSQDAAHSYIHACLHDRQKDRALLESASKFIDGKYGSELAGAYIMGDVEVCSALYRNNLDKRPVASKPNGIVLVDDEPVGNRSERMAEISSSELRVISEIIHDAGLNCVVEGEFRLIGSNSLQDSQYSTQSTPYSGKIPCLEGGLLKDPELLLAFKDQASKSSHPEVFGKIPCWIKRGEEFGSQGVTLFEPFQGVNIKRNNGDEQITFSTLLNVQEHQRRKAILDGSLRLTLDPISLSTDETESQSTKMASAIASNLIKHILPRDILCGFNHPEGYQLGVVDVALLDNFPITMPSGENAEIAELFSSNFFPVTVLYNAYAKSKWDVMNNHPIGMYSNYGLELFRGVGDPLLRDGLRQAVPDVLWLDLFKNFSWRMGSREILLAKEFFGFDDSVAKLELDAHSVHRLYEAGYTFSSNGANCLFKEEGEEKTPQNASAHVYFMRMGGWPSDQPRPETIEEGLTWATRKKNDPIYNYFLLSVGAEDVIRAAKTPAQFKLIYDVFPREDITPWLSLMPRSFKAQHLEDDLGM